MNDERNKKQLSNYGKYAAIAFQMLATIAVFTFIGYKIDESKNNDKPIFTALLGLLGVIISLYSILRSLNKNN